MTRVMPTINGFRRVVRQVYRHPSNARQRLYRLLLTLHFQLKGRLFGANTVIRYGHHSRFICVLDQASSRRAAYFRLPDWPEMQVWQAWLRPGSFFIDVGANVGLYTVLAADCGATVISIEPMAGSVRQLAENIALNNYKHVEIIQAILSDRTGKVSLAGSDPNRQAISFSTRDDSCSVPAVTLNDIVGDRTFDGAKIDVEGAERLVLVGGEKVLRNHQIRLIQLEWNSESQRLLGEDRNPVAELLLRCGYGLFRPDDQGRLVPALGTDFGPDMFAKPVE